MNNKSSTAGQGKKSLIAFAVLVLAIIGNSRTGFAMSANKAAGSTFINPYDLVSCESLGSSTVVDSFNGDGTGTYTCYTGLKDPKDSSGRTHEEFQVQICSDGNHAILTYLNSQPVGFYVLVKTKSVRGVTYYKPMNDVHDYIGKGVDRYLNGTSVVSFSNTILESNVKRNLTSVGFKIEANGKTYYAGGSGACDESLPNESGFSGSPYDGPTYF